MHNPRYPFSLWHEGLDRLGQQISGGKFPVDESKFTKTGTASMTGLAFALVTNGSAEQNTEWPDFIRLAQQDQDLERRFQSSRCEQTLVQLEMQ